MELRVEDAEVISRAQKRRLADYIAAPFRRQHFAPIHAHGMAFQRLTNSLTTRFSSIMFMRNRFRSSFSLAQFYLCTFREAESREIARISNLRLIRAIGAKAGEDDVEALDLEAVGVAHA